MSKKIPFGAKALVVLVILGLLIRELWQLKTIFRHPVEHEYSWSFLPPLIRMSDSKLSLDSELGCSWHCVIVGQHFAADLVSEVIGRHLEQAGIKASVVYRKGRWST